MDSSCTSSIRGFWNSGRERIPVLMLVHRPVDSFVTYDGKRAADIPPPRYAVRHLVATEVSSCWHSVKVVACVACVSAHCLPHTAD